MKNNIPLILISNDDGFQAKGIRSLVDMLRGMGRIIVCAPDSPRSGYACAFSATKPLRLYCQQREPQLEVWSCNGTPVDCVKLALDHLCGGLRPDIIIGGINHGDNASVNTHYSGTMGVTLEGCMKYIPSVAFSLCDYSADADFSPLAPYVRQMVARVLSLGLPRGTMRACASATPAATTTTGWWASIGKTSPRPQTPTATRSTRAMWPSHPPASTSPPTSRSRSSPPGSATSRKNDFQRFDSLLNLKISPS